MKKILISLFLAVFVSTSVFAMSYDEAKTQGKPIVIMFHMHGCGACRRFSPIFDRYASKFSNKFNFVKEDINKSSIASTLQFETVPAIFIVKPGTNSSMRVNDSCAWNDECFTKTLNEYN